MPSFDIVLEPDRVELRNACDQAAKEIANRFDFKGTSAALAHEDVGITLYGDSDFQLEQVRAVLVAKLAKRGVDLRFLDEGKAEKIGGDKLKQVLKVKAGIDAALAKKVQARIKESKLKVQSSIQGDILRVQGAKRDDLQAAIALVKRDITEAPLTFKNFRD
jgi:uncharacterized protein YajQ (UPF0234 family)